jgi:uncharacterized protein GlcG (DUF336 family)
MRVSRIRAVDCRPFFDAVNVKAREMGVAVSSAVVGPEGNLIALERMDDAGFITPEFAIAKAYTVAAMRTMSPRFQDGMLIQKWFMERNPQLMMNASVFTGGKVAASGGSAPIFHGNDMAGAYAISGATSNQDEEIAEYARLLVGWKKVPEVDDTSEGVKSHINEIYGRIGLGERKL